MYRWWFNKVHPSFYVSDKKIKNYLVKETNNLVQLCNVDVILEAQMLFEIKYLRTTNLYIFVMQNVLILILRQSIFINIL